MRQRLLLAGVLSLGLLAPVPAAAQVTESGVCPSVVVLAARGSEQNEQLSPTRYSPGSPWESNGYEERTIRAFLQFAEARHVERTGESLLRDVHVLGLDDSVYPALLPMPALAEEDEALDLSQTLQRLGEVLAEKPAHVIAQEAHDGLVGGLRSALSGTQGFVDAWETASGCTPGYILLGYSQGAAVLYPQEQFFADRGQLVGSLYFGNPLHTLVQQTGHRISHCVAHDFACDLSVTAVREALASGGGPHTGYYRDVDKQDGDVADAFAGWITGYTPRT